MNSKLQDFRPDGGKIRFTNTLDGFKIRYGVWNTGTIGTIFFLNGRTEYIEKYSDTISKFLKRQFSVVSLDWRSQGLSQRYFGRRDIGHINDFKEYQTDLKTLMSLEEIKKLPKPFVLVSHSMGGLIGLRAISNKSHCFSAAIFSAPAWGAKMFENAVLNLIKGLAPVIKTPGIAKIKLYPGGKQPYVLTTSAKENALTSDEKQFKRLQSIVKAEPKLLVGPPTVGWGLATAQELEKLEKAKPPKIPILIFMSGEETVVDNEAIKRFAEKSVNSKLVEISRAKHEVFLETPKIQKTAWSHIDDFLSKGTKSASG